MNEEEWMTYRSKLLGEYVVYRVEGSESGFLDMAKGTTWDEHVELLRSKGVSLSLTLLARNLTQEQAKQFVELSKEEE